MTATKKKQAKPLPTLLTDPVGGVGLVIVGVFVMGVGGAATAHYLFNFGTGIAILGALLFVVAVTLSTYGSGDSTSSSQ